MRVQGAHTFQAPVEPVFDAISDIEAVRTNLPGFKDLVELGPDHHRVTLEISVVVSSITVSGEVRTLAHERPSLHRVEVTGSGSVGSLRVDLTFRFAAESLGTRVSYEMQVDTTGALSVLGSQVLEPVARRVMSEYLASQESEVAKRAG
ncbi:MAG: CoxG family protein [Dehalococcoidia bacterium]